MNHCGEMASFLLGELSDQEAAAYLDHVKRCEQCRADLEDVLPLSDILLETEDADSLLPKELKQRTLDAAFARRAPIRSFTGHTGQTPTRRYRWLQSGFAIIAVLIVGIAIGRFTSAPASIHQSTTPATMLTELSMIPKNQDLHAKGMAMVYQKGAELNLVVYVENMQPLDAWGCYTVWTTDGRTRRNLGDFSVSSNGDAVLTIPIQRGMNPRSISITREPSWNDRAPAGRTVLVPTQGPSSGFA